MIPHPSKGTQGRAREARENPDTPEAEEWREALTRDLEAALDDLLPKCQPKGDVCDI